MVGGAPVVASETMSDLLNGIPRVDPTTRQSAGVRRAVGRLLSTKPGAALHRMLAAPIDAPLMRLTRGHASTAFGKVPFVVLRTTGARSGAQRDVPLVYFTDENPQRRGRIHLVEHPGCAAGAQHIGIADAIRAAHHAGDDRGPCTPVGHSQFGAITSAPAAVLGQATGAL